MRYEMINEEYKYEFLQIPKVFNTDDEYITLSTNAKVVWGIFRDRSSVSKKNKWFDKETGHVYFIYRNQELMRLLGLGSERTLIKAKRELAAHGLIEEVRRGGNRPNKMYLKYPFVEEDDINQNDEEIKGAMKNEGETVDIIGTTKNEVTKSVGEELSKMQSSYTESSYTEFKRLDTRDTGDTEKLDFGLRKNSHYFTNQERENLKNAYFKKAFYGNTDHVPEQIAQMLSVFSETEEQAAEYYKIIMTAKKNAEKSIGYTILLEDDPKLIQKMIDAFVRSVRKVERERTIDNPDGYIYKAIYALIESERGESILLGDTSKVNSPYREELKEILLGG